MKRHVALFLIAFSLILLYSCQNDSGNAKLGNNGRAISEPAPEFQITTLDHQEVSLSSLQGKVILINFWATWCPPCRAEIPDFTEAYTELKDRGLEIIGFSVDDLPETELKAFVEKARMNYPVALVGRDIVEAFKPGHYIPTSILIDKKGNIRHKHVGKLEKEDLVKIFEKLSKE
jgi:peroxiredoxin